MSLTQEECYICHSLCLHSHQYSFVYLFIFSYAQVLSVHSSMVGSFQVLSSNKAHRSPTGVEEHFPFPGILLIIYKYS